jgi:hypothetical protein
MLARYEPLSAQELKDTSALAQSCRVGFAIPADTASRIATKLMGG